MGCCIYLQPKERRSGGLLPRKFKEAFAKSAKASGRNSAPFALYNTYAEIDMRATDPRVGIIRCSVEARFRVERSTLRGHLEKGACSDMP
jgi:hypothetical protein